MKKDCMMERFKVIYLGQARQRVIQLERMSELKKLLHLDIT